MLHVISSPPIGDDGCDGLQREAAYTYLYPAMKLFIQICLLLRRVNIYCRAHAVNAV